MPVVSTLSVIWFALMSGFFFAFQAVAMPGREAMGADLRDDGVGQVGWAAFALDWTAFNGVRLGAALLGAGLSVSFQTESVDGKTSKG